jgi:hypothetical protein
MTLDAIELFLRYAILPLLTIICTVAWSMHKKHDERLEKLEERANDTEKDAIEVRTAFRYVSNDIKEIKEMLKELSKR